MSIVTKLKRTVKTIIYKVSPDIFLKNFWEKRGRVYSDEQMSGSYRLMYDEIANLCLSNKPKRVLEYGCGYGYLLKRIEELDHENTIEDFYGIDFSSSQITNAREYFPRGKFYQADLTKHLSMFSDDSFDAVFGVGVLMYIQTNGIENALKELKRICRRDIYIIEFYYKHLDRDKQKQYREVMTLDGRCIYDYEELLQKSKFQNVVTKSFDSFTNRTINKTNSMAQTLVMATVKTRVGSAS